MFLLNILINNLEDLNSFTYSSYFSTTLMKIIKWPNEFWIKHEIMYYKKQIPKETKILLS
jgi:hypothetical protein